MSYVAAVLGAVNLAVLLVIAGLVARRQAAREAAFAIFGVIAFVSALAGLGGLLGGNPSGGSGLGGATALACAGLVLLLSLERTGIDFEMAEMARAG